MPAKPIETIDQTRTSLRTKIGNIIAKMAIVTKLKRERVGYDGFNSKNYLIDETERRIENEKSNEKSSGSSEVTDEIIRKTIEKIIKELKSETAKRRKNNKKMRSQIINDSTGRKNLPKN